MTPLLCSAIMKKGRIFIAVKVLVMLVATGFLHYTNTYI